MKLMVHASRALVKGLFFCILALTTVADFLHAQGSGVWTWQGEENNRVEKWIEEREREEMEKRWEEQDKRWEEKRENEYRQQQLEEVQKLVVMIENQLGEGPTMGAGIIFGRDKERVYVATANHVVRKGSIEAQSLRIKLRDLPDKHLEASLLEQADRELDLAVLSMKDLQRQGLDVCTLPLDHLGEASDLKRGDAVYPVGNPNGVPWGMPVAPDRVSQLVGNDITFQSTFVSSGHSGGGLLDEHGRIVGLIKKDAPPYGLAMRMEKVLQVLQQWGYPVQLRVRRGDGMTPLHIAAQNGDLAEVKRLLADICPVVNMQANYGKTPNEATVEGRLEITKLPNYGKTPLHEAASKGRLEIVELLIERGANINAMDGRGNTPLHTAAEEGHEEIVKLLLGHGANANVKSTVYTPLQIAARKLNVEIAKLLITAGADVNAPRNSSLYTKSPLQMAVSEYQGDLENKLDVVKLLVDNGANVNGEGPYDRDTPLSLVLEWAYPDLEVAKFLIEKGANVNTPIGGTTFLHKAVSMGWVEVTQLLIANGANVGAEDNEGDTPLQSWIHVLGGRVVGFGGLRNFREPSEQEAETITRLLLQAGATFKEENERTELLYAAASRGLLEVVKLLLAQGADVNGTPRHATPLEGAASKGKVEAMKLLLNAGAKLDRNSYQGTVLHMAVRAQQLEAVNLLLEAGANPNDKSEGTNATPLDLALKNGYNDIANILRTHGGTSKLEESHRKQSTNSKE